MRRSVVMRDLTVDYCGKTIDNDESYEKVIIHKYDNNDSEKMRKVFYFNKYYELNLRQARYILNNYRNCSRLKFVHNILIKCE